jgi:capsid protein
MPRELSNWIIIGENYQLLQGNGTAPNQIGLFNATGTLTRQHTSTGGDTIVDTVLEAVTDIRVGGAYARADLILLHPNDWLAMRKLKTSFGSYVLDPNDPNTLGGIDNIFGIRVVTSTQVPQHSAARAGLQDRGEYLPPLGTRSQGKSVRRFGVRVQPHPLPSGDPIRAGCHISRSDLPSQPDIRGLMILSARPGVTTATGLLSLAWAVMARPLRRLLPPEPASSAGPPRPRVTAPAGG